MIRQNNANFKGIQKWTSVKGDAIAVLGWEN